MGSIVRSSSNFIRVMKLRAMSWAKHVECMGKKRGVYRTLMVNTEDNC